MGSSRGSPFEAADAITGCDFSGRPCCSNKRSGNRDRGRLSPVQTQVPVGSSGVVVVGLGVGVGLDVVVAIRGSVVGYASSVGFPAR